MFICPVCSYHNDDLALKCISCGSFVQNRVPNIDFFSTLWSIIEKPFSALHTIIIAERKNYVLFLFTFLGIAFSFSTLWFFNLGNEFDNLLYLLLYGLVGGIIFGIPLGMCITGITYIVAKIFRGKGSFKNTYAIIGWVNIPIVISVVFILPLEIATLGLTFFSTNPSPAQIKPTVYYTLLCLDSAFVLWTVILAIIGLSIAHKISFIKSFCIVMVIIGILAFFQFFLSTYK